MIMIKGCSTSAIRLLRASTGVVLTGVRIVMIVFFVPSSGQRQPRAPWRRVGVDFSCGAWISASRNEIESDGRDASSELVMIKVFAVPLAGSLRN
jgi:hypothetical protein